MKGSRNNKKTPAAGFPMPGVDVQQLEGLLDFMAAHGLEEFEYDHGGMHIRLKKAPAGFYPDARGAAAAPQAPSAAASAPVRESVPDIPAVATTPAEELHIIKSPIVGTFYAAAAPEAAPFVRVGDAIDSGQVVCIIEAMKLMNEIEADMAGEVVRALVENGQPVEYGQALFAIRPTKKKA